MVFGVDAGGAEGRCGGGDAVVVGRFVDDESWIVLDKAL